MSDLNRTVLIADDDRRLALALDLRCRELGLKTLVVYDAISALTAIRHHRPDVICLDVEMPAGNGLSVCEMLANDKEFSSIPVIILTGRRDHDTVRRCHSMCAYYVLKSNDTWGRVEPLLRELLELGEARQRRQEQAAEDESASSGPASWLISIANNGVYNHAEEPGAVGS
ncbi:MAG: response regulator [Patescibacteria group bacterium]|nr:response regulator [Patescibacteria group bacterium]